MKYANLQALFNAQIMLLHSLQRIIYKPNKFVNVEYHKRFHDQSRPDFPQCASHSIILQTCNKKERKNAWHRPIVERQRPTKRLLFHQPILAGAIVQIFTRARVHAGFNPFIRDATERVRPVLPLATGSTYLDHRFACKT